MPTAEENLRSLLDSARVASLAVLDASGAPALSLVPIAIVREPLRVLLFVSELSPHTQALRADPRCALLFADPPRDDDPRDQHALRRLTVRADARFLPRDEAVQHGYDTLWRTRFPNVAPMLLGLSDFHFVELTPRDGTFIQGFGAAFSVDDPALTKLTHQRGR